MITESLIKQIDRGREGLNQGYSMGMPKLESIIDGVTKQTYTVVFSNSGTGKTNFMLYCYIYRPLMEHLDDDNYRVVYISLEMNEDMLFAKLLSTYIFEKYGIELGVKDLLSRTKGYKLPDEYYNIVQECVPWLKKIESKMLVYDKSINAKSLYALLHKDLENFGTFSESEHRITYQFNNTNLIYNVVIDHISLIRPQTGHTLKQEIDEVSKYLLTLRNICGISPTVIQQANREQGNMARRQAGMVSFTMNDTKDSGGPVTDAEIVISIFNPNKERLATYNHYDIATLGNTFRSICVLKDRYGDTDIEIGCNFFGKINVWKELPLGTQITDFTKYTDPSYILEEQIKKDKKDENANEFKMTM